MVKGVTAFLGPFDYLDKDKVMVKHKILIRLSQGTL
jgi:hypothetical protein